MALVELGAGIPAAFTRPILGVVVKVVFSLFCRICCQRRHCCGSAPILCVFVCVCVCCVCVFIYLFIQYLFPPSVQLSQGCGCSFLAVPLVEGFYQLNYIAAFGAVWCTAIIVPKVSILKELNAHTINFFEIIFFIIYLLTQTNTTFATCTNFKRHSFIKTKTR